MWDALPGVEKRKKLGERAALIGQLWSAIEALPDPEPDAKRQSKRFEYEGQPYRSLSVIAKRITGAHWSGPRFFGLTKPAVASAAAEAR